MELGLLNRIVDYNENLAYVTLEPGVTQRQLFEYLEGKKSNLMMSVTGSTPDSSLIGNTLERGVGKGPLGDRFAHICGLEVVLVNLSMGVTPHARSGKEAYVTVSPSPKNRA